MGILTKKYIEQRIGKTGDLMFSATIKSLSSQVTSLQDSLLKQNIEHRKDLDELKKKPEEVKKGQGLVSVAPHPGNQKQVQRALGKLIQKVTPAGTIDGINAVFTLPRSPFAGFIILAVNGKGQTINTDFTLSGNKITYTISGPPNSTIQVGDTHEAIFF